MSDVDTAILATGAFLLALFTIGKSLRYVWSTLRGVYRFIKAWEINREQDTMVRELVLYHLQPNSGHSLVDAVHSVETRCYVLEKAAGIESEQPLKPRTLERKADPYV